MTPNPVTVSSRTTLGEVADVMRELDIRHVPVVDGGALVGMLSDRDLAAFDLDRLLAAEEGEPGMGRPAIPVVRVMSTDVITVEPDTGLGEVVALMIDSKVGAVPVLREGTRQVVGIVSYIDVLRALQDLLED
jgi:acetoin utilization protein AcuB